MLALLFVAAKAQVKGHTYYALESSIDGIRADILLEIENDGELALGRIYYDNGSEEGVGLYGRRDRKDENAFHMEEHLDNGQWTGNLDITVENGAVKSGIWSSPQGDKQLDMQVNRVKSFPYSKHRTFFHPVTTKQAAGHYVNYIRDGRVFRNDRALNIMPSSDEKGYFTAEVSAETVVSGMYQKVGENELMYSSYTYNGESPVTLAMRVYEEFIDVAVLMADEGSIKGEERAGGFYIREKGVLEVTHYAMTDDIYPVRARLENGVASLIVSKKRLQNEEYSYVPKFAKSRYEIEGVEGRVIDMFIGDVGIEVNPVLCLLLEDHRVQIVPMEYFLSNGIILTSKPLGNMEDIQYFMPWDPNEKPKDRTGEEGDMDHDFMDELQYIYGIDSKGESHPISLSFANGDYMLRPKDTIDSDTYLGLALNWDLHVILNNQGGGAVSESYYGTFWVIEETDNGTLCGYRMHERCVHDGENATKACNIEGKFIYQYVEGEYPNINVEAIEGLPLVPEGGKAKFTFMDAVG